jgi:hypothetical protein
MLLEGGGYMPGETRVTTDPDEIRRWVEERGGRPATVKATRKKGEPGILRIDFPGFSGEETLEPISWEEFFRAFDENNLAFLYQETTKTGEISRFSKFVDRDSVEGIQAKEKSDDRQRTARS